MIDRLLAWALMALGAWFAFGVLMFVGLCCALVVLRVRDEIEVARFRRSIDEEVD